MNTFLKIIFLALVILFQLSFLNILFPELPVPILPMAAVVAWTLVAGFPKSLAVTVPLTLIFEFLSSDSVTALSLYAVGLGYATSFLSRRLLIERRGFGLLLYGLFSAGGVLGYQMLGFLRFALPESFATLRQILPPPEFSYSGILWAGLLSVVLFMVTYTLVKRLEKFLEQSLQRRFSEVK